MKPWMRVAGWVVLVPAIPVLLVALWLLWQAFPAGDTVGVKGRVVGLEKVVLQGRSTGGGLGGTGWRSVVEFSGPDGRATRFTDPLVRQHQAAHRVGESVSVRYPPAAPSQARVESSSFIQLVLGVVLLVGSSLAVLAGGLMLRWSRPGGRPAIA